MCGWSILNLNSRNKQLKFHQGFNSKLLSPIHAHKSCNQHHVASPESRYLYSNFTKVRDTLQKYRPSIAHHHPGPEFEGWAYTLPWTTGLCCCCWDCSCCRDCCCCSCPPMPCPWIGIPPDICLCSMLWLDDGNSLSLPTKVSWGELARCGVELTALGSWDDSCFRWLIDEMPGLPESVLLASDADDMTWLCCTWSTGNSVLPSVFIWRFCCIINLWILFCDGFM